VSDTAPLAALLASHPAEVADALAWLVERSHVRGVWHSAAEEQGLTASFDALCGAEIALRGGSFYWLAEHIDGRAIARMGAAAWLRARCGVAPAMTRAQAIAIAETVEGPRCVWDSADMGALVRHLLLGDSLDHRPMLARMVAGGIKRAEREAAWAAERLAAAEGAQAPKGEQR